MTSSGVREKPATEESGGKDSKAKSSSKRGTAKAGRGRIVPPSVKQVRIGVAALLAIAGLVIAIVALASGGSSDSGGSQSQSNAVALSEPELLARVSGLGEPAFWVGPRAGTESYELTTTPEGRVYVRYLTGGAEAGDPRPDFLTVGTYPVDEAKRALKDAAESGTGEKTLSQHKGFEVLSGSGANNAYVVFDNQPRSQIEVFSPEPGEAAELAASGALKPIE